MGEPLTELTRQPARSARRGARAPTCWCGRASTPARCRSRRCGGWCGRSPCIRCRAPPAELEGLAEFGGEPLPVLNLARLVNASPGANPSYPVTVVVWVGPAEAREMIGFAADAALEVVHVPAGFDRGRRRRRLPAGRGAGGRRGGAHPQPRRAGALTMSVPGARGFLLLRRAGGVWGIANEAVDGLAREGAEYRIAVGRRDAGGRRDPGRGGRRCACGRRRRRCCGFWPEAAAGVAVHGGLPVVVVDPRRLPAARCAARRGAIDEGEDG